MTGFFPHLSAIVAGVLLAMGLVAVARRWAERELRVYATGLLVAALVYGIAAVIRSSGMLPVEWLGVALFAVLAFAGLDRHRLLAAGWAFHVAWDLAFPVHHTGELVPTWYPWLCVGFDLALAAYVASARTKAQG